MRNLIIFTILSLIFHLTSFEGVNLLADSWLKPLTAPKPTEVELLEKTPPKKMEQQERPIVRQLAPLKPIDSKVKARFESEKQQRVQVESQARQFGLTQNQTTPSNKLPNQKQYESTNQGDLPEFTRHAGSQATTSSVSKVSIELPNDIQHSDTTNLNTDANIYYSFYNRVEELYRVRWEQRLNSYWIRLSDEFKLTHLAGHVWSTTFEIVLKGNGEYFSSTILQSSGYPPFDESAIFSFKDARYFPNVPKAKVEADGFVRLRYRFSVHVGS